MSNQDETGPDCGGMVCRARCAANAACGIHADCAAELLCAASGRCVPASCQDEMLTSPEILTDCGGGECPGCPDGTACRAGTDCESLVCGNDRRCAVPSCTDDLQNGTEPVPDCGNVECGPCPLGADCTADAHCSSGSCIDAVCQPTVVEDADPCAAADGVSNDSSGSCYLFAPNLVTWVAARQACFAWGGDLVSLETPLESNFIVARITLDAWIGINDRDTEGAFVWSNGTSVDFSNWGDAQPDDFRGQEDCVAISVPAGSWLDTSCDGDPKPYICER